jgi:calcineurin-like phosphoesterase family protein
MIISNLNTVVGRKDTLYHLGDFSFGGHENIEKYRKYINCENIHLVLGNHDHHIAPMDSPYRKLFSSVTRINEFSLKIPATQSGVYGKQKFVLCHYAMRVWPNSHHGAIMLYGHSHGTLDELTPAFTNPTWVGDEYFIKNYRTMDVGVDTHSLYPYHLDEIMDIMKAREIHMEVDHHSSQTT